MVHNRGPLNLAAPDDTDPFPMLPQTFRDMVDGLNMLTSTTSTGIQFATGWAVWAGTIPRVRALTTMGLVTLSVDVERTGAAIAFDATGNIADTAVMTLPAGFRPARDQWLTMHSHVRPPASCVLASTGVVSLAAGPAGITYSQGLRYRFSETFDLTLQP
jgi:hypothetical protein